MEVVEKFLTQYGFGVTVTLIMFYFFYRVLDWVMKQQDKIMAQSDCDKKALYLIIEGYKDAITVQTQNSQIFHEEMKRAFGYNRDEHMQAMKEHGDMIQALGRINGYKHD